MLITPFLLLLFRPTFLLFILNKFLIHQLNFLHFPNKTFNLQIPILNNSISSINVISLILLHLPIIL